MKNKSTTRLIGDAATIHESELAKLAGLTTRRLRQLAEQGNLPVPNGGTFPAAESITRLISQARLVGDELRQARLGKIRAEETLLKMQIEQEAKRLVPIEWVENFFAKMLAEITTVINSSPLPPESQTQILKNLAAVNTDEILDGVCKPQPWMQETDS